jgi:hypothetical protein
VSELVVQLRNESLALLILESSDEIDVVLGGSIDQISDHELLNALILWNKSSTVNANDWLVVSSVLLVSTVVSSLLWHFIKL